MHPSYRGPTMGTGASGSIRARIGQRLRELRVGAGISSQEGLAHKAGVHRTYVGRLERGESGVTVDTLAAITAAMSVSLAAFFQPFDRAVRPKTPRQRD